jgi:hypothetical protein
MKYKRRRYRGYRGFRINRSQLVAGSIVQFHARFCERDGWLAYNPHWWLCKQSTLPNWYLDQASH